MVYKRFRVIVLARILLLSGTIYLFLYLIFKPGVTLYATIFILGILIAYQIYSLIYYVEKTNRDLNRFLLTIKHEDFSQTFIGQGLGSSFDDLKRAFNDIIQKFHAARADKEEHFRYLQTVVQHVGIALIAFESSGEVSLVNNATKKLLRISKLKNVRELEGLSRPLVQKLTALRSGQRALVKIQTHDDLLQLAVNATEFRMRGRNFKLVSLQNIQSELEERELEAWQNLIRVLTHEIMNSVTPIASLASTVNEMLNSNGRESENGISDEIRSDIHGAMQTIQKRSDGLLHFVDAYRNLTRLPVPNFEIVPVVELFGRVRQLMLIELSEHEIDFQTRIIPDTLELTADPDLIEQILINMLKNAIQALEGRPDAKIEMSARIDERGRVMIQISDNGPGIPQEMMDKIFIPFFTTKEQGSGIGLSLSRQIMRLHRGAVGVHSIPDEFTTFTLRF